MTLAVDGREAAPSRWRDVAFIGLLCQAQLLNLMAMNQTVTPVLLLGLYFDINDYGTLSWMSAAYSMTVGTFLLPAGKSCLSCCCCCCCCCSCSCLPPRTPSRPCPVPPQRERN